MALPTTRNTTYAAGSQVKSVDLNAFQDEIITLHTQVFSKTLVVPAIIGTGDAAADWVKHASNEYFESVGSAGILKIPLVGLRRGDRISAVRTYVKSFAGANVPPTSEIDVALVKHTATAGTSATVTGGGPSGNLLGAGAHETILISPTAFTLAAGEWLYVLVNHGHSSGVGFRVYMVEVDYTIP